MNSYALVAKKKPKLLFGTRNFSLLKPHNREQAAEVPGKRLDRSSFCGVKKQSGFQEYVEVAKVQATTTTLSLASNFGLVELFCSL